VTDGTDVPKQDRWLLLQAYAAYNRRDLEALLALVSDDVDWPDDPRSAITARRRSAPTGLSSGPGPAPTTSPSPSPGTTTAASPSPSTK